MRIQIQNIGEEISKKTAKGYYKTFKVGYTSDGQSRSKDLVSFEKEVYNTIKAAVPGESYDISLVQNGNFWNWTKAEKVEGTSASTGGEGGKAVMQTNNRFESPEERAARQVYIIRQSSVASAVAAVKPGTNKEDILDLAQDFVDFVLNGRDTPEATAGTLVE